MNKRQAQRLMRVALALRESPTPEMFSMDKYVHDRNSAGQMLCQLGNYSYADSANFCGTPACALGHYGARTDMQRIMRIATTYRQDFVHGSPRPILVYNNNRKVDFGDRRIQKYFGITYDQAEDLFGPHGCNFAETPTDAARYIVQFVFQQYGIP